MHYTGTEKVIFNISSMMQKAGHNVKVLTYSFYEDTFYDKTIGSLLLRDIFYKGIPITAIKHKYAPKDLNISVENDDMKQIAEDLIIKEKPDIIHSGHLMRIADMIESVRLANIPYVITLTDFWLICPKVILVNSQNNLCPGPEKGSICNESCKDIDNKYIISRLRKAESILNNAKMVIAPSAFLASIFQNEFPDLNIKVISHGLNYKKLIKNNKVYKKGEKITFCYAGSLNPHKGVHIILNAFKKIKNDNIYLDIYGSGDNEYEKYLKNISNGDKRIKFRGVFTDNQIGEVFNKIDILIVPSLWYETYSLVLHEALACGIPVFASNVGVMKEKIKHNINGLTFTIGDEDSLKRIMQETVSNPEIINEWKANVGRIYIPSIEQEAYEYEILYKNIILNSL